MTKLFLIAAGGGAGSVLRYLVAGWGQRLANGSFPAGTLAVNLIGCFAIGVLMAIFTGPYLVREEYRFLLVVGVLGGFTTFSAFGWETLALVHDRQWWRAVMNLLLSNLLGLAAVWLGYRLAQKAYGV